MSAPNRQKHLLRIARQKRFLSCEDMAKMLNVSPAAYHDLEDGYDLRQTLPLSKFFSLCRFLQIRPSDLFEDDDYPEGEKISFAQVAERLVGYLIDKKVTLQEFENSLGWTLKSFVENPDSALDWNIDCFDEVCKKLNIRWYNLRIEQ